jgi:hypothetical protein
VELAAQQPRPAGEQEVDAGRLGDLLDDRCAEDGQQEEAAGTELVDGGADDAEGATDGGDQDREQVAGEEVGEGAGRRRSWGRRLVGQGSASGQTEALPAGRQARPILKGQGRHRAQASHEATPILSSR